MSMLMIRPSPHVAERQADRRRYLEAAERLRRDLERRRPDRQLTLFEKEEGKNQ